jgi:hypothetical protein
MDAAQLLSSCAVAMAAVFVLLGLLAATMEAIIHLFPETESAVDPVIVAAITNAVAAVAPGARVTRIEEER